MSKPPVPIIKLLLIEDSVENAERLTSMLRNAGISVRAALASNAAEFETQMQAQTPDIVLINSKSTSPNVAGAVQAASRGGKDVSVVVVLDALREEDISNALRDAAHAVALATRSDQFVAVVRREAESLTMRRSVRRLEAALRESERRCDALLDSSRDPVAYVHEGMHVRANKAYLEMFGYEDFDEIEGVSILDMIAPEAADGFKTLLKNLSKGEKPPAKLDIKARGADGKSFDAVMEFTEASYEGEPCQQIVLRRPVASAELAAEIDALRSKDLVTDLFNRAHGLSELDRMVAEAASGAQNLALLLIEPDHFRKQLDTIGIGNADLLLGDMANLMRRHLDSADVAARMGEHTFGVLLRGRDVDAVNKLAEELRKTFEEHIFEIGKQSVSVSISIGGTLIGEKNAHAQNALSQASAALRAAQDQGGNRINVIDPGLQDRAAASEVREMQNRVMNAIKNNGFSLYYQPVVSLHGAEGEFHEILVRMVGEKGEIMPNAFFPIAEQAGLLPAIDRCVIAGAIKSVAEREKAGRHTTVFIKLTTPSLEDAALLPWIASQLKNERVRGDALVFEMAESKVVTHLKPARAFVAGLKQLHCGFALEQFGSGVNSFQLLKHIDATYLKVDRSYMADLTKNKENQEFIRQFCQQAHAAGKLTIAEFVEDAASMSILFTCGVNFVQGNFLHEPERVIAAI